LKTYQHRHEVSDDYIDPLHMVTVIIQWRDWLLPYFLLKLHSWLFTFREYLGRQLEKEQTQSTKQPTGAGNLAAKA
jgi:hypothetical protein